MGVDRRKEKIMNEEHKNKDFQAGDTNAGIKPDATANSAEPAPAAPVPTPADNAVAGKSEELAAPGGEYETDDTAA